MTNREADNEPFNDFDTLLSAAIAILRMAQLAAPCRGPEERVSVAIDAVKSCRLEPLRWSWCQSVPQSILEETTK